MSASPFSKVHLESEIIVYQHLLDNTQGGGQMIVGPSKPVYESGLAGKLVAKSRKKRSIGISKCELRRLTFKVR
jgi:hypothetical protein